MIRNIQLKYYVQDVRKLSRLRVIEHGDKELIYAV